MLLATRQVGGCKKRGIISVRGNGLRRFGRRIPETQAPVSRQAAAAGRIRGLPPRQKLWGVSQLRVDCSQLDKKDYTNISRKVSLLRSAAASPLKDTRPRRKTYARSAISRTARTLCSTMTNVVALELRN